MDDDLAERLDDLNARFYREVADEFDRSRRRPWPGWSRCWQSVRERWSEGRVLDLGCGNGRLAKFLAEQVESEHWTYHGIDRCEELLTRARSSGSFGTFACVDFMREPLIAAAAEWVTLFGVLHHLPGPARRRRAVQQASLAVVPGGLLTMTFWEMSRRREVVPNRESDIPDHALLERGGALLPFGNSNALRYCHCCDPKERNALATFLGWEIVDRFSSDGRDGASNEYVTLRRPTGAPVESTGGLGS